MPFLREAAKFFLIAIASVVVLLLGVYIMFLLWFLAVRYIGSQSLMHRNEVFRKNYIFEAINENLFIKPTTLFFPNLERQVKKPTNVVPVTVEESHWGSQPGTLEFGTVTNIVKEPSVLHKEDSIMIFEIKFDSGYSKNITFDTVSGVYFTPFGSDQEHYNTYTDELEYYKNPIRVGDWIKVVYDEKTNTASLVTKMRNY